MLFKLSLKNMRRSMRDYAIYFFTLIIGVAVFYVFNALEGQAAMMELADSKNDIVELLSTSMSGVSVFVAFVLAFLIVYASGFLMKRRNREFALYMLMGMGKGEISKILIVETVFVGLLSLIAGLALGVCLSQLMSAVVANLFEADMMAYRLMVSKSALMKTILFFAIMYLAAVAFNVFAVSKMKLIDLMRSGKRTEKIKMSKPVTCIAVFSLSALSLAWAYYQVGFNYDFMVKEKMILYIAIGAVSTFFIFWSVSGLLLRVKKSRKNSYYKGLNAFTLRQINWKINTTVLSMTVICLMLFLAICALTSGFMMRNSFNVNLDANCPADAEIKLAYAENKRENITDVYKRLGFDLTDDYSEYARFKTYADPSFTLGAFLGGSVYNSDEANMLLLYKDSETIVKLSDYNKLMRLYKKDQLALAQDEYILVCDYTPMIAARNAALKNNSEISLFSKRLHAKYLECADGFISIGAQRTNSGIFIVSDEIVPESAANAEYFIGNYKARNKEQLKAAEARQREMYKKVMDLHKGGLYVNTALDIKQAAVGLGAILTFIGLYIGVVFLIACGAVLALKELSESVDSARRYDVLRKIGADENEISRSLFRQTGMFFLFPLFGIR